MRRQLIATTALIALAAILVLGVPLGWVESARARSDAIGRLEREADGIAAAVDEGTRAPRAEALTPWLRPGHAASHADVPIPSANVPAPRPPATAGVRS